MGRYVIIRKEFSFLQSDYSFQVDIQQKSGSYYYVLYTNGKKRIMVLYDDTVDKEKESPVWIRIYDADCLGTAYDDVDEFRKEFFLPSGSPKERIHYAAMWLREAIEGKAVTLC